MTTFVGERPPSPLEVEQFLGEIEAYVHSNDVYVEPQSVPTPEIQPIETNERNLTEVDHLNQHRRADGTHSPWTLQEVSKNLVPAVKEAAMPYAVSTTYQERQLSAEVDASGRRMSTYMWLGKTAVQVAESGYKFHKHHAARERVGVEVEEARDNEANLRPGYAKVFISPRMSRFDASEAVAKAEHLAHDDSVRVSWADADTNGNIRGKYLQSLLARDIPLAAWVAMLRDPQNIFGKSIDVEDERSALAVMKAHAELEVPVEKLPEGVVSVIEAVVPYIANPELRKNVMTQLQLFRTGQEQLHKQAESVAERWKQFEVGLADSLYTGYATPEVKAFIYQLQDQWNNKFQRILAAHTTVGGDIRMTRELAAEVEAARQNTLWTAAAVVSGNEKVLDQLSTHDALQIRRNEERLQQMRAQGYSAAEIAAQDAGNNRFIAQQAVQVGSGCPGESNAAFKKAEREANGLSADEAEDEQGESGVGKKSIDYCRIPGCPTSEKRVWVGGCRVCLDLCQPIFDAGDDPEKVYIQMKNVAKYN